MPLLHHLQVFEHPFVFSYKTILALGKSYPYTARCHLCAPDAKFGESTDMQILRSSWEFKQAVVDTKSYSERKKDFLTAIVQTIVNSKVKTKQLPLCHCSQVSAYVFGVVWSPRTKVYSLTHYNEARLVPWRLSCRARRLRFLHRRIVSYQMLGVT